MNLLAKKSIIFFLILAIIFNLSDGFLKLRISFAEGDQSGMSSGEGATYTGVGSDSGGGSGGAASSALCIPNIFVIAGLADGVEVGGSSYWCQLADAIGKVYDRIMSIYNRIADKMNAHIRDVVAKRIMDYIVDQTVQWIQGGGKPKFIGNWNAFLKDVGDIAFDSVIKEVGLADLCSPFGLQVKLALLPVKRFQQRIDCTLDKVVSNIENFYVDFSVGGWDGYLTSWEPNNNFYGQILLAQDEIAKRTAEQKDAAKSESIASKGFLGVKKCKGGGSKVGDKMRIKDKEGNLIETELEESDLVHMEKDIEGNYCPQDELQNTTPGDLVGESVASAITSDKDWAANIQSWTSALVNAFINRLFKEGLSAMLDSESSAASGERYYPPEYQSLITSDVNKTKSDLIGLINKPLGEWRYLLNAKSNSLVLAREVLLTLQEIKNKNCSSAITDPSTQAIVWQSGFVLDSDIQNAQNTVNTLQSEIDDLKKKIAIAEALINKINVADTVEKQAAANFEVSQFMSTYNTEQLQANILNGDARRAADQQTADLKKQLEDEYGTLPGGTYGVIKYGLRTRLATCRATAIVINSGASSTTNQNVILNINTFGIGINNANQMMISNDSAFSGALWEAVTAVKSWTLTPGAGLKTVYVRFSNILGEISNIFSDDITLQ